jgi:hypothetical protein
VTSNIARLCPQGWRSRDWLKFKNPNAPAIKREAEGGWD